MSDSIEEAPVSVLDRFRLDGARAVVTGAGRGIGRACAIALAQAGASELVLIGRTEGDLLASAELVHAAGAEPTVAVLDVTDVEAMAAAAVLEGADILVNNAGTNEPAPFLEVTPASYDRIVDVNLRSVFFCTQRVAADLVRRGRPGAIVTISSQMGLVGSARRSAYSASKHAVEGFTKSVAVELAPLGIRVNTVAPTYVRTPLTEPFFANEAFAAEVRASMPMGRIGSVDEVTGAVVYLCSPAASLVTGSCLVVDGGWTAH